MSGHVGKIADTVNQAKKLVKRVEELEEFKNNFNIQALGMFIEQTQKRLEKLEAVNEAVVSVLGTDVIQKAVDDTFDAKIAELRKTNQASIDKAAADGYLSASDTVAEGSLLFVTEQNDRGVDVGSRIWAYLQVPPEIRSQLLGKKVGDTVPTVQGGTLTVAGIYLIDEAKAKELVEAQAAAAASQAQVDAAAQAAASQAPSAAPEAPPAPAVATFDAPAEPSAAPAPSDE